jgi:hypothetical protein
MINSDPSFLDVQNIGSKHIFKYLVDMLNLAIRLRVISRIVDQVAPEGCVQLLPKVSGKL